MIYFNIPWATNKNIGQAYNNFMEMLPNDDDFACFIDGDAMFLHPFFGKQLEEIVAKYNDCGIFTAKTNRIQSKWQKTGDWNSNDIAHHREVAQRMMADAYLDCEPFPPVSNGHLLGGVVILIKKSTWRKVGGFKNGLLGVDNELHIAAEDAGEPIMIMKGVYVYHWYRGGVIGNKAHLIVEEGTESDSARMKVLRKRQEALEARNINRPKPAIRQNDQVQLPARSRIRYERTKIMNRLITERGYESYLEIGVQWKESNFNHIVAKKKIGVDPDPKALATFCMGSDEFFAMNKDKFDLIFIDGLHESEQVKRDIQNALDCLNEGGIILVHDCLPTSEPMQRVPRITRVWTGDVWKAIVDFKKFDNLSIRMMDIETGIAIIERGSQIPFEIDNPTYEDFEINKYFWFKFIGVEDLFKKREPIIHSIELKPVTHKRKAVIYSAITGDYDKPITHKIPEGWEYKLFTNSDEMHRKYPNSILVKSDLSDVKLARRIKILPWEYFDFDVCLWIDGNTVFDETKLEGLCCNEFVVSKHPERDCIYDEASAILSFKKDSSLIIDPIVMRYKSEGYPAHNGLVASHAIIRWNKPHIKKFCEKWWNEVLHGSHRDQMSFDYVLWKNPMDILRVPFRTVFRTVSVHRKPQR